MPYHYPQLYGSEHVVAAAAAVVMVLLHLASVENLASDACSFGGCISLLLFVCRQYTK